MPSLKRTLTRGGGPQLVRGAVGGGVVSIVFFFSKLKNEEKKYHHYLRFFPFFSPPRTNNMYQDQSDDAQIIRICDEYDKEKPGITKNAIKELFHKRCHQSRPPLNLRVNNTLTHLPPEPDDVEPSALQIAKNKKFPKAIKNLLDHQQALSYRYRTWVKKEMNSLVDRFIKETGKNDDLEDMLDSLKKLTGFETGESQWHWPDRSAAYYVIVPLNN